MPQAIGQVIFISGNVKAVDSAGNERALEINSMVFLGETIVTEGIDSRIMLKMDNNQSITIGRNDKLTLDSDIYDPNQLPAEESIASVESIQEALLNDPDFDPSQLEAAAAGGADNASDSSGTPVFITHTQQDVDFNFLDTETPNENINTTGISDDEIFIVENVLEQPVTEPVITANTTNSSGNTGTDTGNVPGNIAAPTISIADTPDSADNTPSFSGTSSNTSGDFTMNVGGTDYTVTPDVNGNWSFTIPNGDALADGNYTATITGSDALGNSVSGSDTVLIVTNNAPILSVSDLSADEDGAAVTGTASFTDVDLGDTHSYSVSAMASGEGSVSIDAATGEYTYNPGSDFQSLALGATTTVSFDVTVTDNNGGSDIETVTVTLTGSNDAATVSAASVILAETDSALTTGGTLTSSDVDNADNSFTASSSTGTYGDFSIDANGVWDFTANSAFNELNVGQSYSESFTVSSVDGTASTVTIQINGSNDAATVSAASVILDETDSALTTGGTLTSSDVDNADNSFTASSSTGTYGDFSIDANGVWDFTANSAFNELNVGQSYSESFTVSSVDGTASTVTIQINGSNDAATVSAASMILDETDSALTTGGTLTSSDVDNADNSFTASSSTGTYGDFSIDANGVWDFTANSAFNELNVGQSYSESFTVSSVDGTASTVTIQINGSNDAATVSAASVILDETDSALTTGGTLTSTDVDNADNSFTASSSTGTYGDFSIDANGVWDFTANSAFNELNVGQSYSESFTVSSVDGTASTVTIQINGSNDAATVSAASVILDETDSALTTGGTLTSTDVDNADNSFTASSSTGTYGDFSIDANGVWDFTANSAFNELNVGQSYSESFTVSSVDGTASTVTIQINGSNDAATVSAASVILDETDSALTTGGTLTSSDVDNADNSFTASSSTGTYGDFSIDANGVWDFTANSAFNELNVGQSYSESFTVSSVDGTASTVTIQINGSNDAATVSAASMILDETDSALTTGGTLTSSDVDNADNSFTASSSTGTYGDFSIDANGVWDFTANSAFNELNVGQSYSESFTVSSVDGTASTVTIQINGSNDAATVSAASVILDETDSALTTGGTLTSTDVDNADNSFTASSSTGTYGDFSIDANGVWDFTANSAFNELNVGQSYSESFTVSSVDGTASTVTIQINGSNDAATVSAASVILDETDSALTTGGTLTSTDVDNADNSFTASSSTGTYGDFSIDANGVWDFTANSAFNELNVGQSYSESFTVSSVDGTASTVTIQINGSNDAATVSAASMILDETDSALTTGGTLTSTDVDNADNSFTASSSTGTYGDFSIDANGVWDFTANSAFNELNVGQSYSESFTVSSVDGTASTVTIQINGSNDAATVSAASMILDETDSALTTGGTLTSSDVDNADNSFTASSSTGTYGDFSIDANGVWDFTANSAFNELNVGQSYSESFTVSSVDGTASTVTIQINGSNDAATVSAASVILDETDSALTTGGTLTSSDVDNADNSFTASSSTGTYGDFSIDANGVWDFTANSAFNELNVGQSYSESFTVSSVDGTASTVTIQINGSNDAATVSAASVILDETDSALTTGGTLTSSDVDNADNSFTASSSTGTYGDFSIDANGVWDFTANSAFNELNVGQSYSESFTVSSVDGTASTVTIQINGSNDAATVSAASVILDETDSALTTGGTLTSSDVDNADNSFTASSSTGTYGDFSIDANGVWDFTANSAFNELNVGQSYSESFTVSSVDGTASTVTIQINGSNDAATVSAASVILDETDSALTTGGTLTSTDVDNADNSFTASSSTGTYGDFSIDANGVWDFTANSAFNELNVGQSYSESFTVSSVDGTASTVTIQINGSNDAATVSAASVILDETDSALTTGGTLTSTDVDNADNSFTASSSTGTYGDFSIDANGVWDFTANSAFNELNVGQSYSESFTVSSVDGTASTVTIQINGSNDAATVSAASVILDETDSALTTGGTLTSTDVDNADNSFTASSSTGTYGDFSIDANGVWDFTANSAFNELNVGQSYSESFTVSSVDGTASTVTIQINGSNDAATVSAASVILDETDSALTTGGTLTSTDVDNADNSFTASSSTGTYGDFSIDANGVWDFTANSAFNELNVGQNYSESFTVSSVDGTASTVTIQINGSNDAATVSAASVILDETDSALTTGGTLTSSDVDNADNSFTASSSTGTYGDFSIDANGVWDFTANSAFNELNVGQSYSESFTVSSVDGTASTVTIQINGSNDAATVSAASVILDETDSALTTGGTLTSTDVDNADNSFTASSSTGTYGDFSIDANGVWDFTANSAFNELNVGQSYSESFTVSSVDGTASTVTIQINGSNDAATVSAASVILDETDSALTTGGTLTSSDVDNADNSFTASSSTGTYGDFSIDANGVWDFTANSAFNELNVGQSYSESFTVSSVDGTASTVTIQINGSNDAATVSAASVILDETDSALTTGGTLTSTDVDNADNSFTASSSTGTYGDFSIDANGVWDFTANSAFNELNVGQSYSESFTVSSVDGTASTVTIQINGSNDAATVSAASVILDETDSALTTGGTLTSTDVDNADNSFTASSSTGTYGDFSIDANGVWDFTANSAFNELNVGQSYSESFTVSSVDGTASTVTIQINGSNDAATVSAASVILDETDSALTTGGTLTSTDVDNADNSFTASSSTGTYGDFSIDANGVWDFTANSAFNELNVGQSYSESFTVSSVDGTASTVTIQINGSNDAATVSAASVILDETDSALTTGGTLTSSDVDNADNSFTASSSTGTYGDFSIDANGVWDFTANSAFNELNVGQSYSESFTVSSVDGTASTVTIQINGSNDAATVSAASVILDETDSALTTGGTLTSSDVDNADNSFTASSSTGTYGDFSIDANGVWDFTANSAFNELNVGQSYSESFTVSSVDGTASTVTIQINGSNDAATVSAASVILDETDSALTTGGTLTSSDVDNADNSFTASSSTGTYGDFSIDANGVWDFTANSAFNELNVGQSYSESFTVSSVDGTASTVTIQINGSNDAATVSAASVILDETDSALTTGGTLTSSDVDNADNSFTASSSTGTYGDFSIDANGVWDFTANSAFNELNVGQSYSESFTVSSVDGTASTVTIQINGSNDAATVSAASVILDETDSALTTGGTLTSTDVDNADNSFTASSSTGTYGDFSIDANGVWDFTANSAFNELNVGQSYSESFTVSSVDGTASTVTIQINGSNDAATVSAASVILDETDSALTTGGTLTSSDVDNADNSFTASSSTGTYGDFSIDANGVWDFTANSAFNELNVGQSYSESFTVSSVDGTASTVTIQINGSNDAATVSAASVILDETDSALTTGGTLTSSDVDNADNSFTASSSTGTYGDFSIDANGVWDFTANSAFNELNVGQSYSESFTVSSVDGTASTVTIQINGSNDAATVSAASVILDETDSALTTGGTLTSSDVDNADNSFTASSSTGTYGDFSIDANGVWDFTANSAFNELNVGQSYSESFTVSSVDGTASTVTIQINGSNDAATVSAASVILDETDSALTTGGTLTSSDVDNADNSFTASSSTGTYGDFSIDANGVWDFTANSAFNELNVGQSYSESFTVSSVDGTASTVTIQINGSNDAATVSAASVILDETDSALTTGGTLTSSDVDNADNSFTASSSTGTYGDFSIDANGVWDFTANSAFNELNVGQSYSESFTVSSVDGTASTVTIQINGSNDAATVSAASVILDETDSALTTGGTLTSSDVDNADNSFTASSSTGTYGDFSIDANGVWDFTANSAFNELNVGQSYSESFTVSSVDGTASTVTIQINGSNDAATVSAASVILDETDSALTTGGTLTSSDVDNADNSFTASSSTGTYGDFSIDANGVWDFTANSAFNELNVGQSYSESFTVSSVDGTASTVTIQINGSNDAATVSAASVILDETDSALTTGGTLTSTDVDNADNSFTASSSTGTYGDFSIDANGVWDFTANSAFNELNVGQSYSESFTVSSVDGTASTVTIQINGSNDAATVSAASVILDETDSALTTGGTLTSSDVDNADNSFTASSSTGTYGDFSIDANGVWDFTANSAFNELNVGQSYSESFTVSSVDGTASTVTIQINGSNDAATVSAASVILDETDSALTTGGTLTSSDVDNADNSFTASSSTGTYGDFSIDANGVWDFTANSAFNELNVGQSYSESFTVSSVDGTASTVTIQINGSNDAATVSAASVILDETDSALTTGGTLTSSDVDNADNSFTASSSTGTYGDFSIDANGVWDFTANSAFNELNVGQSYSESFTVSSVDGTASTVTIQINGSNDAATVSAASVILDETDSALTTGGTLTSSDVDNADNSFTASSSTGTYGDFSIDANGVWDFTANSAFNELNVGQSYSESFTVSSVDGTASTVTIQINGSNDAATVSAASVILDETDSALTTGGTLTSSDVDNADNSFTASSSTGTYGDFSIDANGVWDFTANSAFNELNVGQSYSESFTVSSVDGTASTVTIQINGSNDAATVSAASVILDETDSALTTGGTLTSTDVDNADNSFTASSSTGTYGDFSIDANGVWDFTANSAFNELNVGQSYSESFTVSSVDGTASTVTIQINGSNDAATVSAASVILDETDSALTTGGTLTSSDVDNADNSFTASSSTGTYGDFSIDANGVWDFTANSAFNELNVGQSYSESFTVSSVDGTASTVTIQINGSNDAATVSAASVILDETDSALTTGGTLTSSDVDNADNSFTASSSTGTYGDFSIDANGVWDFTANSAFNELNVGQSYSESFTVSSVDGTASTVTIQINGSNDAATVSAASVILDETDSALTTGGTLTSSDVDNADNSFTASSSTGTYGDFSIDANGVWDFTANSAFNELNVGQSYSESFTVSSVDGTASTVTIQINGSNDAATVSAASVILDETDSALTTGGTLTSSDVDNADNSFTASSSTGTYGDFSIDANGVWDFTANSAFNELNVGQSYSESFTVSSVDGTASTVTIQINGSNDAATVSAASVILDETDSALTTGGTLTSSDVDNADNSFTASSSTGTYGDFSIDANGVWDFTANSAFNELNVGQSYSESFTVSSVDGTASTVTIQINGSNDAATVSAASVILDETDSALTTGGTLTSSDVDNADNSFTASSSTGTYGDFSIDANGVWDFTANSAFNELNVGQSYSESFTVSSVDGTASTVTIQINGSNDAATVSAASVILDETDSALTTGGTLTSTDVDNADNSFTASSSTGTYGDFSIDANGVWDFTANSAFNELNVGQSYSESFTVSSVDGTASTVTIQINGSNDAPIVVADSGAVTEDITLTATGNVLTNDSDVDVGDSLTVSTPGTYVGTYGTLLLTADGNYTYTLDNSSPTVQTLAEGQIVLDAFNYTATDGTASSNSILNIEVTGTADSNAVIAGVDTGSVTEDALPVDVNGTLTIIDPDVGEDVFVAQTGIVGSYGEFSIDAAGGWAYTGNNASMQSIANGVVETETFNVVSADGTSHDVVISITGTNDAPVLSVSDLSATEDGVAVSGTASFTDVDLGDTHSYSVSAMAAGEGSVSIDAATGEYTYNPGSDFQSLALGATTTVSFDISVTDNNGGSDTETVTVTLTGTNDAPLLSITDLSADEDGAAVTGTASFTDIDLGDTHSYSVSAMAAGEGSVSIDAATGEYTYSPGSDFQSLALGTTTTVSFDISVTDNNGGSDTETVTVTLTGTNDAPLLSITDLSADEDGAAVTGTASFTDVDLGDTHSYSVSAMTAGEGSVSIDAATGEYTYSPGSDFQSLALGATTTVSFDVTVTDNNGVSDIETVTVTITGTDDATVTISDVNTVDEDNNATGNVLTNDSDVDNSLAVATFIINGDTATYVAGDSATISGVGTLTLVADGSYTFSPVANWNGNVPQVTYTTNTGSTETLDITVVPVDDASVLVADTNTVDEDNNATGNVLTNDSDVDDTLAVATYTISGDTAIYAAGDTAAITDIGTLVINTDGSYIFTPVPNYSGVVPIVTYTTNTGISDTLTLTITPVADPVNDVSVLIGEPIIFDLSGASDTSTTTSSGIEISSNGDLNINSGLGIGVDSGTGGGDQNRIDVGETITFDFPVGMQSMLIGVKNTDEETISLSSDKVDLDTTDLANINIDGSVTWTGATTSPAIILLTISGIDAGGAAIEVSAQVETDEFGDWSISSFDASSIVTVTGSSLSWEIDGDNFGNGANQELNITTSVAFHDMVIGSGGTFGSKDGYQIEALEFGISTNINYYSYPIDINAILADTDNSESISSISLSGFPSGSSIKVVSADGLSESIITSTENTLDGSPIFEIDPTNNFDVDGNFLGNIYLTLDTALLPGFEPTISITTLDGSSEALTIVGGTDDSEFDGSVGNDYIGGGAGNDILSGGEGDDILAAGLGNDSMTGDAGADLFVSDAGNDIVTDYNQSEGDVLILSDLLQSDEVYLNSYLSVENDGSDNVKINVLDDSGVATGHSVVLEGVSFSGLGTIDASNPLGDLLTKVDIDDSIV